jgi:hypothetical protein
MATEPRETMFEASPEIDLPAAGSGGPPAADAAERVAASLGRIEDTLEDLRRRVETLTREQQHKDFSWVLAAGYLGQVLVAGLLVAALADWVFAADLAKPLMKLLFAGVLQIGALTAFVWGRGAK